MIRTRFFVYIPNCKVYIETTLEGLDLLISNVSNSASVVIDHIEYDEKTHEQKLFFKSRRYE